MKLIIDIPEEAHEILMKYQVLPENIDLEYFVIHGIPLEEELKAIKEDMKDTFYDYKNNRYDVSMEGVLDVLDKHIKENKK